MTTTTKQLTDGTIPADFEILPNDSPPERLPEFSLGDFMIFSQGNIIMPRKTVALLGTGWIIVLINLLYRLFS